VSFKDFIKAGRCRHELESTSQVQNWL